MECGKLPRLAAAALGRVDTDLRQSKFAESIMKTRQLPAAFLRPAEIDLA
jgi:hypothetical protein